MSRRRQYSTNWRSGHAPGRVPPGYGERHVRTAWFGTGETRLRSLVSKDRPYKPMVKLDGAQRESDGVVVLPIAGRNPAGGKDPGFGHVGKRGTREGMAGSARSNFPEGKHLAPVKVRCLQNRLWATAKQSKDRAFHALFDRITRDDILWEAWERVRANRGAKKAKGKQIRDWHLNRRTGTDLSGIAQGINPQVRGWINYCGAFYRSELYFIAMRINEHLVRWAMQKFKRLRGQPTRAWAWLDAVRQHQPSLFAHWHMLPRTSNRPVGAG
jgi:hypothetical protein